MNSSEIFALVMGMFMGAFLMLMVLATIAPWEWELKDECEQDLPISQVCVMQYVPEK